jgi:PAS domain S-box-containing protein
MRGKDNKEEESEHPNLYRELFEHSADAILVIEDETFVDCNRATMEMLHYRDKAELLSTHPSELSPPTQPDGRASFEKANEMIALAFEHGSHRFEWDHKRADGEIFPVEVLLTVIHRGAKPLLHVVWRDITERKQLEEQLRHAQKMEALGRLTGGIAHDFNNLLVAIIGHSELLQLELDALNPLRLHVEQIRRAGDRAAALVRQLLAFSRKQKFSPRVLDLPAILKNLEAFLPRLIGEDIQLTLSAKIESIPILADPIQIEQIVINLATNGRDAMHGGGTLSIEAHKVEIRETSAFTQTTLTPGSYACLTVTDSGVGMDGSTMRQACDPYFTTKAIGKGTGLGLATVYGIARQAGGGIHLQSTQGEGTTVTVYLPITEAPLSSSEPHIKPSSPQGGCETILLVEDEIAVSHLVVQVLQRKGYQVLLAPNGVEALKLWRQHEKTIDLLVTDVVMPEKDGISLVRDLRQEGFSSEVLFISGYTSDDPARIQELGKEANLLAKPFTTEELAVRIREALDRSGAGS